MNRRIIFGLAMICVVIIAVVSVAVVLLGRGSSAPTSSTSTTASNYSEVSPQASTSESTSPASSAIASSPTTSETGDEGSDPDVDQEKLWRPAVDNFGRQFTNTAGSSRQWATRLIGNPAKPYVTAAVAQQLRTVDPANVPAGRYEGYRVLEDQTGIYQTAVKLDYSTGWSLALYLVTDGNSYQISAYDRYEG